jgi:uncharacterized protein YjiS (DUF1127 family)
MNTTLILSGLTSWLSRALCRQRDAACLRRERAELTGAGAHEMSDLGISHASVAIAAAARRDPCGV